MSRSILIVEDSPSLARTYEGFLTRAGYEAECAATGAAALERLGEAGPDLVLLDLGLPDADGLEILETLQSRASSVPVVVVTANASLPVAVRAMRAGALDYLVKPFDRTRLVATVENVLERSTLRKVVAEGPQAAGSAAPGGLIGRSRVMQAIHRTIEGVAASDASVFITGESGTGKELAARAVHEQSRRRDRAFHVVNCGAIPSERMESQLFGHVAGAFTGAAADREGAAAIADGGTLFLDEICEMPLALQAKLLRFVQLGAYQKVGEASAREVDIRFVCATNKPPLQAIEEGALREDLYYRLNVIPIEMPPLRERVDDVVDLAEAFLKRFAAEEGKSFQSITKEASAVLRGYAWPGNVRQLENVIRNAVVLQDGETLTARMLPRSLMQATGPAGARSAVPAAMDVAPLAAVERQAIERAIDATGGNIQKAAQLLEIDPSTIHRRRRAWRKAS